MVSSGMDETIVHEKIKHQSAMMGQPTIAPQQDLKNLQMAIASDSLQQRSNIRRHMETVGVDIVLSEPLSRLFLRKLERTQAQVLLIDLHDESKYDEKILDELLDKATIPILFNDVSALALNEPKKATKWYNTLVRKIAESTGHDSWETVHSISGMNSVTTEKREVVYNSAARDGIARNVWVLGASLGGPESVKRFLNTLPKDIPAAFILAQHLGANFVNLLAEQLDRITKLQVITPSKGHVLRHQQVVVAPVNKRLLVNPIGNIELLELSEPSSYTPSIDMVVEDVAHRYGNNAGAIIFSGMESDGLRGCKVLHELGGQVWTQSSDSCVVSSMPDNVARICGADLRGTPEELAKRLIGHLLVKQVRA